MRIIFISGVELGWQCAKALLEKKFDIAAIFCLPESMKARSGYADFTQLGIEFNVPVYAFEDVNSPESVSKIKSIAPDLILVVGWSTIIGETILSIPKKGVIGHHPTLLPKHRGNAPIPWTLINGLTESGVTLFFLEKEIDKGGIVDQKAFSIGFEDDAPALYLKATNATISLLLEVLPKIENNTINTKIQDSKRVSKWGKRKPEDGIIDWNSMTIYLYNWVRGLTHPYPGAFTFIGDKKLFIWKAQIADEKLDKGKPGEVIKANNSILVKTGDGGLFLTSLQFEGEPELSAADFIKLYNIKLGTIFE